MTEIFTVRGSNLRTTELLGVWQTEPAPDTSYGLAGAFRGALEAGKTAAEAEQAEVEMLQFVYREPSAAQAHLMDTHNLGGHGPHSSFDVRKYMAQYKERMKPFIMAAVNAGVHLANITAVPAYCVGDVGHHIAQSAYNMFKDDMVFAIYEAAMGVFENTMYRGLDQNAYKGPYDVLACAPDDRYLAFGMFVPAQVESPIKLPPKPEGAKWNDPPKYIDRLNYRGDGQGYLKAGYDQLYVRRMDGTGDRILLGDGAAAFPVW